MERYANEIAEARSLKELKATLAACLKDMIASELELCSYNLAGGAKATREQKAEAVKMIKARVATLQERTGSEQRHAKIIAKCAARKQNEAKEGECPMSSPTPSGRRPCDLFLK